MRVLVDKSTALFRCPSHCPSLLVWVLISTAYRYDIRNFVALLICSWKTATNQEVKLIFNVTRKTSIYTFRLLHLGRLKRLKFPRVTVNAALNTLSRYFFQLLCPNSPPENWTKHWENVSRYCTVPSTGHNACAASMSLQRTAWFNDAGS